MTFSNINDNTIFVQLHEWYSVTGMSDKLRDVKIANITCNPTNSEL